MPRIACSHPIGRRRGQTPLGPTNPIWPRILASSWIASPEQLIAHAAVDEKVLGARHVAIEQLHHLTRDTDQLELAFHSGLDDIDLNGDRRPARAMINVLHL